MNFERSTSNNENSTLHAASHVNNSDLTIQRKLAIGAVNDPLEHEADAMADKVMRMPEQNFVQRKCTACEEEKAQRKTLASSIQKKEADSNSVASDTISNQIYSTKSSGKSMNESTKSFMESRFGADFSKVRIHSDNNSSQLSNQLNAQAFTVGNDIYFNKGKYSPESHEGKHLLAHELTHTIQQNGISDSFINKKGDSAPGETNYVEDMAATLAGLEEDVRKNCGDNVIQRLWRLSTKEELRILSGVRKMLLFYAKEYKEWKDAPTPDKEAHIRDMQMQVMEVLHRAGLSSLIGLDAVDRNLALMDCFIAQLTLQLFRETTHTPGPGRRLVK